MHPCTEQTPSTILTLYFQYRPQLYLLFHANCIVYFPYFSWEKNKQYVLSVRTTATKQLK